jgi:hypothetical protein
MAINSIVLEKGSGQVFLTGILRQFCKPQKCLLIHKRCSRIFLNSAEMGLLMAANCRVLIILSKDSGSKCMELDLFYLDLFIAQCFIDYWRFLRNYILNSFQKLLRKQLFLIPLTLWQPTTVRKPYLTFRRHLKK